MAYSTATNVASMDAVLGLIRTFVNSLGWTISKDLTTPAIDWTGTPPPDNSALGRVLIAQKTDCLVTLRSTTAGPGINRLYLLGAYGAYTSGNDGTLPTNDGLNTSNQYTGGPSGAIPASGGADLRGFQPVAGPFPNLYLFSDASGNYVHVVLEIFAGVYRHMLFGNLIKFGTWTGGAYFASTFWSQNVGGSNPISTPGDGSHCVPFDNGVSSSNRSWTVHYENGSDKWIYNGTDGNVFGGVTRREGHASVRGGFGRMFKNIQESLFSGLVPLGPVLVGASRASDSPVTTRFIGQVPDFRMVNMTNLTSAQEFSIGSDTWKVFPMCAKNGVVGQNNSGIAGFAYKKIP